MTDESKSEEGSGEADWRRSDAFRVWEQKQRLEWSWLVLEKDGLLAWSRLVLSRTSGTRPLS